MFTYCLYDTINIEQQFLGELIVKTPPELNQELTMDAASQLSGVRVRVRHWWVAGTNSWHHYFIDPQRFTVLVERI